MNEVDDARYRKNRAVVHKRMQEPGMQKALAAAMCVSPSTLSEFKDAHLDRVLQILSHLGLRLVDANVKVLDEATYRFLVAAHARAVAQAPDVIFEDSGFGGL